MALDYNTYHGCALSPYLCNFHLPGYFLKERVTSKFFESQVSNNTSDAEILNICCMADEWIFKNKQMNIRIDSFQRKNGMPTAWA